MENENKLSKLFRRQHYGLFSFYGRSFGGFEVSFYPQVADTSFEKGEYIAMQSGGSGRPRIKTPGLYAVAYDPRIDIKRPYSLTLSTPFFGASILFAVVFILGFVLGDIENFDTYVVYLFVIGFAPTIIFLAVWIWNRNALWRLPMLYAGNYRLKHKVLREKLRTEYLNFLKLSECSYGVLIIEDGFVLLAVQKVPEGRKQMVYEHIDSVVEKIKAQLLAVTKR